MVNQTVISAEGPAIAYQLVPICKIAESPLNPRKHFDEAKLRELSDSIRAHGVLTPILVRPVADGFEIAAGHRRYRAAKLAGLGEIPAIVRDLDTAAFLEVLTIENLQREDLHPMEEAICFRTLLRLPGYDAASLAERVGKSQSYVYKRLELLKLIQPAAEAFLAGEIQLGHAIALCRLRKEAQEETWKGEFLRTERWHGDKRIKGSFIEPPTLRDLEDYILRNVLLDLAAAPWPKDDAALVKKAGACTACFQRTGAKALLFDDMAKGDHCLNAACWGTKTEAYVARQEKEYASRGEKLARISTDWLQSSEEKKQKILGSHSWRSAGNKACDNVQRGIVVAGRNGQIGEIRTICTAASCKIHRDTYGYGGASKAERPFAEVWAEKRKRLDEKIKHLGRIAVWRALLSTQALELGECEQLALAAHLVEHAHHDRLVALCDALELVPGKGEWGAKDYRGAVLKYVKALDAGRLGRWLAVWRVNGVIEPGIWGAATQQLGIMAKEYGIKAGEILEAIQAPLIEEFNRKRERAKKREKERAVAAKKAKKAPEKAEPAAPVTAKKKTAKKPTKPRAGVCRVCGCTDEYGCDGGCKWAEPDLCSTCAEGDE